MNEKIEELFSEIEADARSATMSTTKAQSEQYLQSILTFAKYLQEELDKV